MTAIDPQVLVKQLEERGVKRVKLGLADIDGVLRGKYLSMDKLASLAGGSAGFCDCIFGWDVGDVLYDNGVFSGWHRGFPDTAFRLDLSTLRWLPDEPETPFFLAELAPPAGAELHPVCPRNALRRVLGEVGERGYASWLGFEYEFFVFDETPHSARDKGYRGLRPYTPGMFGYSVLRSSVQSDLLGGFLDYCDAFDLPIEGFHTETGPGVLEAALKVAPGLTAADRAVLFKTFTKVYFQRRNLLPTFMAKWSLDYPGQSGHLHLSLCDLETGAPLFHEAGRRGTMSPLMESFVAGQQRYLRELTALVAPTVNSYRRLVKGAWAPTAATWGIDNRTCALRVIPGSPKSQRIEYRVAAADGNPYLVAAAALASGLEGIDRRLTLEPPVSGDAYGAQDALDPELALPPTLRDATALLRGSNLARRWLGDAFVDHFANSRDWESRQFERAVTDWELARYLEII